MEKRSRRRSSSVGRFLLDVLKPTPAISTLGKRMRGEDSSDSEDQPIRSARPAEVSLQSNVSLHPQPACIALQNEDPFEDAIVITALNVIPFCCHADLITMARAQLLDVAATLNAKLPLAMQINTDPTRSDASIRHSIELLVGLRTAAPQPKPTPVPKSCPRSSLQRRMFAFSKSPITPQSAQHASRSLSPTSPLADRSRASNNNNDTSFASATLAILHEHSEDQQGSRSQSHYSRPAAVAPPQKKRRTDAPITRALSRRVAPFLAKAAAAELEAQDGDRGDGGLDSSLNGVRTHVPLTRTLTVDSREPTLGRRGSNSGRSRSGSSGPKGPKFAMTSTPRKRAVAGLNSPRKSAGAGARRFRSIFADLRNSGAVHDVAGAGSVRTQMFASECEKEKTEKECAMASVEVEVTFGIEGMTTPIANVDVDADAYADEESSDMDMSD